MRSTNTRKQEEGLGTRLLAQRRSDIRVSFGVSSGRVCIILYGYNGARDEKTKWRRRKFPSGISPE